jgi:Carboxypeptidase regulatory-like domain/TonB dependent receptor-like, beta-barrel
MSTTSTTSDQFRRMGWLGVAIGFFLITAAPGLRGQVLTQGAFVGTVRDASKAVIPGVTVSATNEATAVTEKTTTDGSGQYRIPQLPPGDYRVEASRQGFRTEVRTNISLTVARKQELDFTMQVGAVTQSVTVSGEAAMVDTESSGVSSLVNGSEVRDLPLNGRSFDQLITLSSGTVNSGSEGSAIRGNTSVFSIAGSRPSTTEINLNGSELAGSNNVNTTVSTASEKLLGVASILEFRVLTNNGDASYGKKPGGQVDIVTRSGSNQFHGSAYEFVRNQLFDARNFFAASRSPLRQNNYGFSVGGPIVRDKTFFFANLEQYRERRGETLIAPVPTAAVRMGVFPDGSVVTVNPDIKPFLDLYPAPNGRDFGDGTAEAISEGKLTVNDNYFITRVDHNFSENSSVFGSYMIQRGLRTDPNDNGYGQFPETDPLRTQLATIGYKKTLSPAVVSQLTLSLDRSSFYLTFLPRPGLTVPAGMYLIPGAKLTGDIGVGGTTGTSGIGQLNNMGGNTTGGSQGRDAIRSLYGLSEQLNYVAGRHFWQFGVQVERNYDNENDATHGYGFLQFADLKTFDEGIPKQIQGPLPGSDASRNFRQMYYGLYAQDSFTMTSNITLNLGLRYEYLSNPIDAIGRTSAFVPSGNQLNGVYPDQPTITPKAFAVDKSGNFAPRVGFAWNVGGTGRTSVRGGFGLFYGQIETEYRRTLAASAPFYNSVTVANPPFPNPGVALTSGKVGKLQPLGMDQAPSVPTSIQYNLTVERQVMPNTMLRLSYVGSHSYHLARDVNPQMPPPVLVAGRWTVAQTLPNPTLSGNASYIVWDANSTYNSLQVELLRRFKHGLQFDMAFTWSKDIDEAVEPTSQTSSVGESASVAVNHHFDRGLAGYNVGRRLVFNWIYDLPFGHHAGLAAAALDGWRLNGILEAQDGFPFSVFTGFARSFKPNNGSQAIDRPDLAPGCSNNPILGGPNEYFNPNCFVLQPAGVLGNLGSGTLIGPGLFSVDTSLEKSFPITEKTRLQFRVDAFNLLNHANFSIPAHSLFVASGQRIGSAGVITSTATDSRELQLSLKFMF